MLRWVTHAPGDVFDGYTSPPWASLCEAVRKLSIELPVGGGADVIPIGVGTAERGGSVEDRAQG